jgi:hypothetical protein
MAKPLFTPITEEKQKALEQEYGEDLVAMLADQSDENSLIFFAPASDGAFARYERESGKDDKNLPASKALCQDCVKYPDPKGPEWVQLIKKKPGLPLRVANEVVRLASGLLLKDSKKVLSD